MRDMISSFGSNVFVLTVDDKAKPIGVTAVTKQAPLIMRVNSEIHDFVKATSHKLKKSVYASCEIKSLSSRAFPEITYSSQTYI